MGPNLGIWSKQTLLSDILSNFALTYTINSFKFACSLNNLVIICFPIKKSSWLAIAQPSKNLKL